MAREPKRDVENHAFTPNISRRQGLSPCRPFTGSITLVPREPHVNCECNTGYPLSLTKALHMPLDVLEFGNSLFGARPLT